MQISDFDYHLPEGHIAFHPLEIRDQSRLMRLDRVTGGVSHHVFAELPELLNPSDLLVLNNTRVFPARLFGRRQGLTSGYRGKGSPLRSQIEVFLIRPLGDNQWEVLVKPGRKIRVGERILFGESQLQCEVLERGNLGVRIVRFDCEGILDDLVDQLGHVPLPPYISRLDEPKDHEQYQTIYAKRRGAVAAPTAGLHFTPAVFDQLQQRGIECCEVTLHVGLGTFQPVHCERVEEHRMDLERFELSPEAALCIQKALRQERRIVAVGTTVTRTLEAVAQLKKGDITAIAGETNLFIYPGFHFQCVRGLVTNFHLPRSTLLMLVCAFAGRDPVMKAYRQAIETNYRFYSYGDCMLIL
jgi:S-adenosylmethionine:tRNA ribosyltransferase-isomerase